MLNASLHMQSLDLWLGLKFSVNVKPPMYDVAMCVYVSVHVVDKLVGETE